MADLIIGGNTYKNTDFVRFRKTDGKIATFYDSARIDQRTPSASISYVGGKSMVTMTAIVKTAIATAKMIKEM